MMIDYFEQLTEDEQDELTELIQLFFRQTFVLERKYEKRTGRLQYTKEYRLCTEHFSFLREYFQIAGITLCENANAGIIYIQNEMLWGEKLPKLATIYLLILKLIYNEQMATVSSSTNVVTTLGAVNGKAGEFHVLKTLPSPTEMKRTITLLKKHQMIEPLDVVEEMNENTRLLIYPSIHAVLLAEDLRELLDTFKDEEDDCGTTGEDAVQGVIENMPE